MTCRELRALANKMMVEDLLSKQKAKIPIWQYVRFKLSHSKEPDNIIDVYLQEKLRVSILSPTALNLIAPPWYYIPRLNRTTP